MVLNDYVICCVMVHVCDYLVSLYLSVFSYMVTLYQLLPRCYSFMLCAS